MSEKPSEVIRSIIVAIMRRADTYVEMLAEFDMQGNLRAEEPRLIDKFEKYVADVLDRYFAPGPRRYDRLIFSDLYTTGDNHPPEDCRRSMLVALLAAEIEGRGPLRLTENQNRRLATVFEHVGKGLIQDGLLLHAAFAFDRAASLYLQVQDGRARDRCLLSQARARRRARQRGWVKVVETMSAVLCGYGYQPHRLLGWIAVQLVAFSIALTLTSNSTSVVENFYACLINYLNPLGRGDTKDMSHGAWLVFVTEGYMGALSLSVFFALLVRRWFRIL